MQQWFSRTGELPARISEMSSWHAILGCAAARMGIAVLPQMVLSSFPQAKYLSVHPLPRDLSHAPTVLIWRKGGRSSTISALVDVLTDSKTARVNNPRRKTNIKKR